MNKNNNVAWDDLSYYDSKIKEYINEKVDNVSSKIPDSYDKSQVYTKEETEDKISKTFEAILFPIDKRLDKLSEDVAVLLDDRDEAEADIAKLEAADVIITQEIADLKAAVNTKADRESVDNIETELSKKADRSELSGLATEEYVRLKIAEAELADVDIDLNDYYTKTETDLKILQAVNNIPQPDLSIYAKQSDLVTIQEQSARNEVKIMMIDSELVDINNALKNIPTKTSQLTNDSGFISEIPNEYITESELESKGYITEHQSLENYATKEFVEESIDNIDIPEVDLTNYYTKEETEALIPTNYATKDDLQNLVTVEYVTENYVTTEQVEEVIAKEVTENTEVQQSIAQEVAKQIETINYGTFGEEI